MDKLILPELPYHDWTETRRTLHCMMQVVGKLRMSLSPRQNHWWHITLYVSETGFTTGPMPFLHHSVAVTFNCIRHQVEIVTSKGDVRTIALATGLSVAAFFKDFRKELEGLGIPCNILANTYDIDPDSRFDDITDLATYDSEYVERFWRIMAWTGHVFSEFTGRSYAKTSPVHLFWHHLDLAVTRFSGRRRSDMPDGASLKDWDENSHEIISFGFWAGDDNVQEPAYYAYTYPSPEGIASQPLEPDSARWVESNGSPMATLMYDDLRRTENPRESLLVFLESAYQAGGKLAGWNVDDLRVPSPDELESESAN